MSRAAPSTALRPVRTTVWSSARTTRIAPSLIRLPHVVVVETIPDRHRRRDPRARTGHAVDIEPSTGERHALPHREQPHSRSPPFGIGDVESAPIVDYLEHGVAVGS